MDHYFQPIVQVNRREDGRFEVVFDWADSYMGVLDDEAGDIAQTGAPEEVEACAAIDNWVKAQPSKLIIPA